MDMKLMYTFDENNERHTNMLKDLLAAGGGKAPACMHCGTVAEWGWNFKNISSNVMDGPKMGMECDQCGGFTCAVCAMRTGFKQGAGRFLCPQCGADLKEQYKRMCLEKRL